MKIKKKGVTINLTERDIKKLTKSILKEDDDWMQDASEDIEKRGTHDVFHDYCINRGYKNGCSKGCWEHADNEIRDGKLDGPIWGRRVGLAKAFCDSRH
tara:strand:+ start:628 stop:924 length:297 start_codon:yes stop_codon:yes gene_type:complete